MKSKIDFMHTNQVWTLVDPLERIKLIRSSRVRGGSVAWLKELNTWKQLSSWTAIVLVLSLFLSPS
jgi:hypothetical protein